MWTDSAHLYQSQGCTFPAQGPSSVVLSKYKPAASHVCITQSRSIRMISHTQLVCLLVLCIQGKHHSTRENILKQC